MIFSPKQLGNTKIAPEEAKADRKTCLRFGPCGIGQKALYLNSFFIDRAFYAAITDVRRVFKRVAMSKNGFTGKGMFGSMPYLVVLLSDGTEKQCNFKFEADVDAFIDKFHELHPSIPIHSAAAEKSQIMDFLCSLILSPLTKDSSSRWIQLEQDKDIIAWKIKSAPHKRVGITIFINEYRNCAIEKCRTNKARHFY